MRTSKNLLLTLFLGGALAGAASAQNQTQAADQTQPQVGVATGGPVTTVDQAIDRLIAREHDEIATIRRYTPIIETYIQESARQGHGRRPREGSLFPGAG